jgi:hypothetical protein
MKYRLTIVVEKIVMKLKLKHLLSVVKLALENIVPMKIRTYHRSNRIKKCTYVVMLFLLSLLLCIVDTGIFKLAQAQTTTYITTGSTTTAKFQIYYGPETTLDQMIGIELAGKIWEQFLGDNVTIKLFVATTSQIPENILGSATAEMVVTETSYGTFLKQFDTDSKSQNDSIAYNNFQKNSGLYVMINGEEVSNVDYMNLTRANAKALGILSSTDSGFDGHIVLNQDLGNLSTKSETLTWSYNYTNKSIPSNSIDFLTTVVHEIGHILGFVSGVDYPDLIKAIQNNITTGETITDYVLDRTMTPLDLYRFSSESVSPSINQRIPDLSIGGDLQFTFDSGNTAVDKMATGVDTTIGGDGDQASHWQKGKGGIMDAYLSSGEREIISDKDLTAFDLIGWDIHSAAMGLEELEDILPTLYEEAKAAAEYKMANAADWFLTTPPTLIKPLGLDINTARALSGSSNTSSNCSSNNGETICTATNMTPSQDSSNGDSCNVLNNYYTSECLRWRVFAYQELWNKYYERLGLLNQKIELDLEKNDDGLEETINTKKTWEEGARKSSTRS